MKTVTIWVWAQWQVRYQADKSSYEAFCDGRLIDRGDQRKQALEHVQNWESLFEEYSPQG